MRRAVLLIASFVVCSACMAEGEQAIAPGTEGWPCPNDNNCLQGFRCVQNACQAIGPEVDAGDEGDLDTGVVAEAGIDAGQDAGPDDAGPVCTEPATLTFILTNIFGPDGQAQCNQAACHGAAAAGGLSLVGTPAMVRTNLLAATRTVGAPEPNIVVPSSPDTSRLYVVMRDRNPVGNGNGMPPAGPVPACDLETVRQWIADGALNN